mmetsp:Transcript_27802/g.89446  ORF Transcript_27802/g.89446 Transcript_27802/m.89446 type:complete len:111 (+) Transcript_27802:196-528(+)
MGCLQAVIHGQRRRSLPQLGAGCRFCRSLRRASSAGMAIVSGVIFSEPLLQILYLTSAQQSLREQGVEGDLKTMPWKDAQELMAAHGLSIPPVSIPTNILAMIASFAPHL